MWCPGFGVVLDCIDSWSFAFLSFLLKLKNEDWDEFYSSLCVNSAWSSFRNIFMNFIDTSAPIKIKI